MEEKSYLTGILGALIGGIVASIPWVLVYVYANMIYSILAVIIGMGALKGYQLFKGKIDKKLPFIIVVVSILSITLATFVIIPCFLLVKNDAVLTINNLVFLYSSGEFVSAIIADYVISLLFTCLGISGVVSSVRKQIIDNGENGNIKINLINANNKKDREKVKNYFVERNATSKENMVTIDESLVNMDTVNILIAERIIVNQEDKYYYSLDEEEKYNKRNKKIIIITCSIIVIAMAFIMTLTFVFGSEKEKDSNLGMKYNVTNKYVIYDYEEDDGTYYYVPQEDLSGDSGYFMIYYLDGDYEYSDEWKEKVKNNFSDYEDFKEIKSENYFKNSNNLDVLFLDIEFQEFSESVYYIFGDTQLYVVEALDMGLLDNLQDDVKNVVNTFKEKN